MLRRLFRSPLFLLTCLVLAAPQLQAQRDALRALYGITAERMRESVLMHALASEALAKRCDWVMRITSSGSW